MNNYLLNENTPLQSPLGKGGFRGVFPIYKTITADNLSPYDIYRQLFNGKDSFLFESLKGPIEIGRYSYIASMPYQIFKSKGTIIEIINKGEHKIIEGNPINILRGILSETGGYPNIPVLPPFFGGAVGFFSYDLVRFIEKIPHNAKDDLQIPDIYLIFVDTVMAFDHFENNIKIIFSPPVSRIKGEENNKLYKEGVERIESISDRLKEIKFIKNEDCSMSKDLILRSDLTKDEYMYMVKRCKEYIAAGDIFQANLSQRFSVDIGNTDPLSIYANLRRINPSPFAAYLDMGDLKIVSSSPERLVSLKDGIVETRPIAGTRPRGKDMDEETLNSADLISNEKERAEHIMLVDLERNDIGKVCEYGSVNVDRFMITEYYSHVMHIVSNIKGVLKNGKDTIDLLKGVFPGGTITGVPKVRCMEIIDELEPVVRGAYTGSIGYISLAGDMDLNIIIRSLVISNKNAFIQVGAGIVADSDPEKEYYETIHKSEAMLKALRQTITPSDNGKIAG